MRAFLPAVAAWAFLAAAPLIADARMYQWVSPASSVPQLSGEPPPWYRSEHGGPRVRVFENGNLVDDTAIALPPAQREELRSAAFREAEARRRADMVKRLERAALLEERRRAEDQRLAEAKARREQQQREALASAREAEERAAPPPEPRDEDASVTERTVEQLKAIIAEFDRRGGGSEEPR